MNADFQDSFGQKTPAVNQSPLIQDGVSPQKAFSPWFEYFAL
jgi:hypothetical protein